MEQLQFSLETLKLLSYRGLQQVAKSLSLPSNVKKVYLIQLIHAKKYKTPAEVAEIVYQVKVERQQLSQVRKRSPRQRRTHLQDAEISSTSSTQSPPIVTTPKRRSVIECSPELKPTIVRYPRPSTLRPFIKKLYHTSPPTSSDRVLRSFSYKPKQIFNNTALSVIKTQNSVSTRENSINILSQGRYPKVSVMAKCLVKRRPNLIQSQSTALASPLRTQLVAVNKLNSYPPAPARRPRILSGIYPIATKDTPRHSYKYIKSVAFRRSDGKMSLINALVQKTNKDSPTYRNFEMSVQNLMNTNVETNNIQDQYPNMSSVECEPNYQRQSDNFQVDKTYDLCRAPTDPTSVYYHRKIQAEEVRCQRRDSMQMDRRYEEDRLPKIHDVFAKVRDVYGSDVTQPIYVQVSEESERILNYPVYTAEGSSRSVPLESLYNFKSQFLPSQPRSAPAALTHCVFATPLIPTPVAHSSTVVADHARLSSCEQDGQSSVEPEMQQANDVLKVAEQDLTVRQNYGEEAIEDFNTSGSSLDTSNSQVLEPSATIPEMVEDALEIISQDGDYMERIGMDERLQCILCSWAGPRFLLEFHIRKEHSSQIYRPTGGVGGAGSVRYSVGGLARRALWLSQVLQRGAALYALSARLAPPACLMASLAMLSDDISDETPKMGYITVYNNVTGEPHCWSGEIYPLSPNLPYYTEANCLTLDLSRLNLVPDSASLAMLGSEPGLPAGRHELDDVHIDFFISIVD